MADGVWVNTYYEKSFIVHKGIKEEKVFDLGVGVNPEEFRDGDGKKIREKFEIGNHPVVLFVGRKEREKGIGTLLDAMEMVWQRNPERRRF